MSKHKEFKILVVPSSSDEYEFEEAQDFDAAVILKDKRREPHYGLESVEIYSFDTVLERDMFIKGYEVAIGNCGEGLYFTKDSDETTVTASTQLW